MADIISLQELADAKLDAQSLERFINGGVDEEVLTRFGDEIMTLKGLEEEVKKSGGYFKRYISLAAANADIANIPVNGVVKVTDAVDGGDYERATVEATSLTKSPYDSLVRAKAQTEEYVADEAVKLFAKRIDLGYSNNMAVRRYTAASTFNDYAAGMYQTLVAGKVQLSVAASGSNAIKHYFNTGISAQNLEAEFTVTHQQFGGDAIGVGFREGDNHDVIAFSNSGNLIRFSNYTSTILQSGLGVYSVGDKIKFIYSGSKISVYLNNVLKGEASITENGTIIVGQMGFSRYLSELGGGEIDPIRDYVKEQIAGASFQGMGVGYYSYNATNQTFFAYTQVKGNLYVGFEVKHEVDMRDLIYQDYWRIFQALFYTFDGETMQPTGKVALGVGESEFVFKQISAKDDFTGGYHGDEIATSIKLMIDGFPISTVSSIPLTSANKLEYIVQSTMHETAEDGVFITDHPIIAYHTKHTEFKNGGYKTRNLVNWNYAGTLSTLYHGIACIHKDVASVVFSDKDYTDQAMTGSGNNYFNAIGARLYKGRNPINGLAVETAAYQQKVDGADVLSELFVHDRSTDSKYYRKSPARTVSIGEKHESYFECYFTAI